MKKLLLSLFLMVLCFGINAQNINALIGQQPVNVGPNNNKYLANIPVQSGSAGPHSIQGIQGVGDWTRSTWYYYLGHALNTNIIPTSTFKAYIDPLFPDSLPQQFYTDPTTNKVVFYYGATQSRGTIFDPTAVGFDSIALSQYSSYTIDSIEFAYCYFRTADTITRDNNVRYILTKDTSHVAPKADSAIKYFIVKDTISVKYVNVYKPIKDTFTRYLLVAFNKAGNALAKDTVYKDTVKGAGVPAGRYVSTSSAETYILTLDKTPVFVPVPPDTVIIDVFGTNVITPETLQFGAPYSSIKFNAGIVPYNNKTGLLTEGLANVQELVYTMQRGDTTHVNAAGNFIPKYQVFALPKPITVQAAGVNKSNQLAGFVLTYRPGYKYSLGDTLTNDTAYNGRPIHKRLNDFMTLFGEDQSGQQLDPGYNGSIAAYKNQEYGKITAGSPDFLTNYEPSAGISTATGSGVFVKDYLYSLFHISTVVSGINTNHALNIPSMVYPDPASSEATLAFSLTKSGMVNIDIYDIVGKKVQNITNGMLQAGKQQFTINTANLNSGMYFYTITVDGASETNKFTVSK